MAGGAGRRERPAGGRLTHDQGDLVPLFQQSAQGRQAKGRTAHEDNAHPTSWLPWVDLAPGNLPRSTVSLSRAGGVAGEVKGIHPGLCYNGARLEIGLALEK